MAKKRKAILKGRSAVTGRFTTVEKARKYKDTHVVERIKIPKRKRKK